MNAAVRNLDFMQNYARIQREKWAPQLRLVARCGASGKATSIVGQQDAHVRDFDNHHAADRSAMREWPSRLKVVLLSVCDLYGVRPADVMREDRRVHMVRARQLAMWMVKRSSAFSLPQIGHMFGGRDHTTVLHAIRKVDALLASGELR